MKYDRDESLNLKAWVERKKPTPREFWKFVATLGEDLALSVRPKVRLAQGRTFI